MWKATFKALLAQRVRLLMTILAVAIGVAFVTGTFVLTDTMSRAFDDLFRTVSRGLAVEVTALPKFERRGPRGGLGPGSVPASLVETIRGIDGVRAAEPRYQGYVEILAEASPRSGPGGGPTIGTGWSRDRELNQLAIRTGRAPERDGEIVVMQPDGPGALKVGGRVRLLLQSGPTEVSVVGTAGFGATTGLGFKLIVFDPETAARLFGRDGVAAIEVAARPGVSAAELRSRVEEVIPAGVQARTGDEAAAAQSDQVRKGLGFLNTGLLVFAGIAIFVGAFIIFNTFQILVSQRARELALLRAIGATPGQVRRSVTAEAFVVGVVASAAGVGGGILLAKGLRALLHVFGATLPGSGVVMQPRTVIAASAVGIGITLLSSIGPAAAASKVPAIAALRDAVPAPWEVTDERVLTTVFLACTGAALLELGLFGGYSEALLMVGAGAVITFLAVAAFAAIIVRPSARVLGLPLRLLGVPGKLGRANAMRNPKRTASTASSLMIGLGLVACVSIVGASWKASAAKTVADTLAADYIVSSSGFSGFSPEVAARLRTLPAFSQVVEIREGAFGQGDRGGRINGADPAALADVLKIKVVAGSVSALGDGEVAVARGTADEHHWNVGDSIPAVFSRTGDRTLRVAGIFEDLDTVAPFVVSLPTFDRNFDAQDQLDQQVLVRRAAGTTAAAAAGAIEAVRTEFPVVKIQDQAEFRQSTEKEINQLLSFVTALLALSVFIALFGIANTLALSVFERTREIGLLRAVGMAPRQVRAMVRWESVIIAVLGALLGTAVGALFGWALVKALESEGVTVLRAPFAQLGVSVLVAALLGVVAAALPARRASRLKVLDAIAYE